MEIRRWAVAPLLISLLLLILAYKPQTSDLLRWEVRDITFEGGTKASLSKPSSLARRDPLFEPPAWASKGKLVVLTSSDMDYAMVLINFLVFQLDVFAKLDVRIVCLDKRFQRWLERHNGVCESHVSHGQDGLRAIWHQRSQTVSKLLHEGYDVLMSDSDAIWWRNPLPFMGPEFGQVVAQVGTFPTLVREQIGATLVMGFVLVRSTPAVVDFFDEFALHARDDQKGFNTGMLTGKITPIRGNAKLALRAESKMPHTIQYERKVRSAPCSNGAECTNEQIDTNVSHFNVTFLSHSKFKRGNCPGMGHVLI